MVQEVEGGRGVGELAVEDTPAVAEHVHEAARGQVVYITEHGERVAAIVPPEIAAVLEQLSADQLDQLSATAAQLGLNDVAELTEDLADRAAAREARARIAAGSPLVPWEQVKSDADL
jgi:antitoxin (DNA-binding transcriptional repressor) of toxin-antitoxin stability system